MRYVYVKNGDAVEQVRRVVDGTADGSGPDAWMGGFLRAHRQDSVLVLCNWHEPDRLVAEGIDARSYPSHRRSLTGALTRARSALAVALAILRWRPDRILCGCVAEMLWASVLAAKFLRIPVVCSRHSGLVQHKGLGRFLSALDVASIRACRGVVCHGPFLAEQVRGLGVPESRIHRFEANVSNFGTAESVAPLPAAIQEAVGHDDRIIMYVGRVRAAKGVFDLLEAFAVAVREGLTKTRLIFIGSGEDSEALQKAINAGGLERQAYMLGQIDHALLPDIMRRATVVVTPTRPELIEGRCKVVIESLALGVPVIAPNFAAFPHAIEQGSNGLLYPAGNVEALKDALKTVLEDSALLQKLKRGATSSVKTLLGGGTSFAAAVEAAFTG